MKNTTCLLLLFTAIELGAQTKIIFKNDTLSLFRNDSIYYQKGDDINGELKYKSQRFYYIVKVENGYITNRKSCYENGVLHSESNYKFGKTHGPFKRWYETGTLFISGNYHDGNEDGLWTYYFSNGLKESEGRFVADKDHLIKDFETNYYLEVLETGERNQIVSISPLHSPPDGEWKFYNNRGTLIKSFTFDKGKIVSMDFGGYTSY
ncbi:MAG: toxin-antitoxin system YwqK family antitoxin [Flavobacteriales bacterium]